jgi:hypothetical protein
MMLKSTMPVIGKGLVTTDGEEWALHRRIVNPAFHHEKLKVQTKTTLRMPLTNLLKKYFKIFMNKSMEKQLIVQKNKYVVEC